MACLGIFAPYTYLKSIRVKASWSIQRKLASNTPNELPVGGVIHEKSRSGRGNWRIAEQDGPGIYRLAGTCAERYSSKGIEDFAGVTQ